MVANIKLEHWLLVTFFFSPSHFHWCHVINSSFFFSPSRSLCSTSSKLVLDTFLKQLGICFGVFFPFQVVTLQKLDLWSKVYCKAHQCNLKIWAKMNISHANYSATLLWNAVPCSVTESLEVTVMSCTIKVADCSGTASLFWLSVETPIVHRGHLSHLPYNRNSNKLNELLW